MIARVPDTGLAQRERQGPRTAVPYTTIETIRALHRGGVSTAELARAYRVSRRTVARYVADPRVDPLRAAVRQVIAEASVEYQLGLTRDEQVDIATEIVRAIRARGWVA